MTNKQAKNIIKSLINNDSVCEAIYCQCVAQNDYISELKSDIKAYSEDLKANPSNDLYKSIIEGKKEDLKEAQKKRRELKKAMRQLYGDSMSEYNA